jgi:hypothetical protein
MEKSEGSRNGASRVVGNLVSLAHTPVVQSLTLADGAGKLSWRADAGKAYRVQFKPDLSITNWTDLQPVVTATNTTASLLDSAIGQDAQRFIACSSCHSAVERQPKWGRLPASLRQARCLSHSIHRLRSEK